MSQPPPELVRVRAQKASDLAELGDNPYANDFRVEHTTAEIRRFYETEAEPGTEPGTERWTIAGRVMAIRSFGKAAFLQVRDRTGAIQVYVRKNIVGADRFERLKLTDIGDIIGVSGGGFLTRTQELSVQAETYRVLTKSLRPLPEKWHGLTDVETRYRQRYVDLIANHEQVAEVFKKRARTIAAIRRFLDERGYLEVETPSLHSLVSGGAAKPFTTFHNTLDMDLFMRVAPELYLKRLVVGGLERVYEIGRNYRNEGISIQHNPEFTMLEFYQAYATYEDLISLTEEMVGAVAEEVCGSKRVAYQGVELDFGSPWKRVTMKEAVVEGWNAEDGPSRDGGSISGEDLADHDRLLQVAARAFPDMAAAGDLKKQSDGELVALLFDEVAEHRLIQPTFVTGFPLDISPLSRRSEGDPGTVDRFEVFVYGRELANAFSELNDPQDQRERFERQAEKKAAGDEEAMDYDEDYVRALEYGMPPTAGEGIGIDRLCMLLTDAASIRDVILFPLLRKEGSSGL